MATKKVAKKAAPKKAVKPVKKAVKKVAPKKAAKPAKKVIAKKPVKKAGVKKVVIRKSISKKPDMPKLLGIFKEIKTIVHF